ncbi:hypothetical protein DSECCO2_628260 [anaerobic digester metagenome]
MAVDNIDNHVGFFGHLNQSAVCRQKRDPGLAARHHPIANDGVEHPRCYFYRFYFKRRSRNFDLKSAGAHVYNFHRFICNHTGLTEPHTVQKNSQNKREREFHIVWFVIKTTIPEICCNSK